MRCTPVALLAVAAAATPALGGPLAYAACQSGKYIFIYLHTTHRQSGAGCNGIAVACYAAAGFTFGVTVVGGPPAIVACNVALGGCMATCATVALLAPTP